MLNTLRFMWVGLSRHEQSVIAGICRCVLKGVVHPEMKMMSSFTKPSQSTSKIMNVRTKAFSKCLCYVIYALHLHGLIFYLNFSK